MCGIIGFDWEDRELVEQLSSCLSHRGPDARGVFVDSSVSLGHRRLSIIDLSDAGAQPMRYKDFVIVFNGEIYNYRELREELGTAFVSSSDTEVILHAYEQWGADCVERFRGAFAFCIYDLKKQELFLARDRFGIKPLYVLNDGRFAFSSELRELVKLVEPSIDKVGLEQFFTFRFTLGKRTLISGVEKFLPGHWMRYDLQSQKREYTRYYTPVVGEAPADPVKAVRESVEQGIKRRMVADVPVACLLSGGLDSSIIAAVAKQHNPDLHTYSVGFETTNELPHARLVADALQTTHHEIRLDKDAVAGYVDSMIHHMDEPIGDPGFLPVFVLSEEIAKEYKVVLSGDGADEVFGGYDRYKLYRYGWWLRHFAFADFGHSILRRLKNMRSADEYGAFVEVIRLFEAGELEVLGVRESSARRFWPKEGSRLAKAQLFDISTLLPNDFFMKADKMSSAHSLEQRVPFMDVDTVELGLSLRDNQKIRFWREKHVLREAFRDVLPAETFNRKKHGFNVPIDYWFSNVLGEELRELLATRDHELYDKQLVLELLDSVAASSDGYVAAFVDAQKLWSVYVFEKWYRSVFS